MNEDTINQMSDDDLERLIFQVMLDSGMNGNEVYDTLDNMSRGEMEDYLLDNA